MKKERILTEREKQRKQAFEEKAEKLISEGYTREDLVVGVVRANIYAVVIMAPFAAVLAWLWVAAGSGGARLLSLFELGAFLVLMLALLVLHEAIHGIVWGVFAENHRKDIEFGVIWSMLTPYCTCKSALTRPQYILGSLMPTLLLGFGLGAAAVAAGNLLLFFLAEVMVFGGGGDFLIVGKLLAFRTNHKNCIYMDHPTECGLVAFCKE